MIHVCLGVALVVNGPRLRTRRRRRLFDLGSTVAVIAAPSFWLEPNSTSRVVKKMNYPVTTYRLIDVKTHLEAKLLDVMCRQLSG